jgi:hypothetical protein
MLCRSLFVLLYLFFWPLCCLFFFDIRFLIAPLVSSKEVFTISGTYPWSFVTQIFHNGQPSHGGDHKIFEMMTSTLPKGTLGSVASLLAATLYQGNPDRSHKLWNIVSTERYVVNTSRSFPRSWLVTEFVTRLTRRVSLAEQELLTFPEHLSSPRFLVGFVLLDLLLYMYVMLIVICPFVLFLLAIVLYLLRYTDSVYSCRLSKGVLLISVNTFFFIYFINATWVCLVFFYSENVFFLK